MFSTRWVVKNKTPKFFKSPWFSLWHTVNNGFFHVLQILKVRQKCQHCNLMDEQHGWTQYFVTKPVQLISPPRTRIQQKVFRLKTCPQGVLQAG